MFETYSQTERESDDWHEKDGQAFGQLVSEVKTRCIKTHRARWRSARKKIRTCEWTLIEHGVERLTREAYTEIPWR